MTKRDTIPQHDGLPPAVPLQACGRSSRSHHLGRSPLGEPATDEAPPIAGALSDIIEAAILPQLREHHRGRAGSLKSVEDGSVKAARLARLLLDDRHGFGTVIAACAARGASWPAIAADFLSPAARGLGTLWIEDACDFLDVTVAMGWLQATTQTVLPPDPACAGRPRRRTALLAPAPGEMHNYGLSLAAGFFRDAGWAVTTTFRPRTEWLASLTSALRGEWYDVLGLSLACDVHVPPLRQAVPLLRHASCNPHLRVIVGGALIARGGADAAILGADACVADGCRAPVVATELLTPMGRDDLPQRGEVGSQPFSGRSVPIRA